MPGLWGKVGVRELRRYAHLSSARSPDAVPLLQLRTEGSVSVSEMWQRIPELHRYGLRESGRGAASRLSDGAYSAHGSGHGERQTAFRNHPAYLSRRGL